MVLDVDHYIQAHSQEFMTGGYIFCDEADGRTSICAISYAFRCILEHNSIKVSIKWHSLSDVRCITMVCYSRHHFTFGKNKLNHIVLGTLVALALSATHYS